MYILALYIYQLPPIPSFIYLGIPHFGMSKTRPLSEGITYVHVHWLGLLILFFCSVVHICADELREYGGLRQESMEVSPVDISANEEVEERSEKETHTNVPLKRKEREFVDADADDAPLTSEGVEKRRSTFSFSRHFFKTYGEIICCFVLIIGGAAETSASLFDFIYLFAAS